MKVITGALAFSAALLVAPASAETSADGNLVARVSYADLDLTKAAGRASLDRRIKSAIRQVCQRPDGRNLREIADFNRCAAQAKVAADKSVLVAVHNSGSKLRKA